MNCMETRALVEDALDESLSGNQRRALDLHLSRCDKCREFFATEREEHRRWFQAMNEPQARRRLPDGFAEDFLAAMAKNGNAPQKMWKFARLFRRIAAALAAMLLFAGLSYAAVVAIGEFGGDGAVDEVAEMQSPKSAKVSGGSAASSGDSHSGDAVPDGEDSSATSSLSVSAELQKGGAYMTKTKVAAAAFTAALAAAPLAAAGGEAYQYIIATPYPEADVSHSAASEPMTLNAGAIRVAGVAKDLEARSRSNSTSASIALNALEFKTFIITVR